MRQNRQRHDTRETTPRHKPTALAYGLPGRRFPLFVVSQVLTSLGPPERSRAESKDPPKLPMSLPRLKRPRRLAGALQPRPCSGMKPRGLLSCRDDQVRFPVVPSITESETERRRICLLVEF